MTGTLALLTGTAYLALAVMTVVEMVRHRHTRGFSHFGLAFTVMALTCGPHYLTHGVQHLGGGTHGHGPMLASMAIGALPAVAFLGLRFEAALGGRGDRLLPAGTPLAVVPWVLTAAVGATLYAAVRQAAVAGVDLRVLVPNAILFASYALVGFFAARAQLARRPRLDGWSLSGVSMSAVFVTCGVSHLVAGLLTGSSPAGVVFDNLGVPASLYFLWAVYGLHRDSRSDWNRRPLVGRAAPLGRRSPWAEPGA
jgi:hypothetical protein